MKKIVFFVCLLSSSLQAQLMGGLPLAANPPKCGAVMGPGVYKEWMCYNLGADPNLDPYAPNLGKTFHGDYYQWGYKMPACNVDRATTGTSPYDPTVVYAGFLGAAPTTNWQDATKTSNDPCPTGFRVPTLAQWAALKSNNTATTYTGSDLVFDVLKQITRASTNNTTPSLRLPFGGYAAATILGRPSQAVYLTSTYTTSAQAFQYLANNTGLTLSNFGAGGFIRCISE